MCALKKALPEHNGQQYFYGKFYLPDHMTNHHISDFGCILSVDILVVRIPIAAKPYDFTTAKGRKIMEQWYTCVGNTFFPYANTTHSDEPTKKKKKRKKKKLLFKNSFVKK
ncbi:hypothetical protein POVCU2_0086970 [Plasmodium ovale curtisi]|uniref:Uncharacterized protein n=1 Tax=Plasmodium ovale curtisi TaxID=864141 RepID=A0A1A8WQX7_PLAOA|nr:hypothetical protein POVCU2_0086970 [Plasmodium ovale curtisi]